MDAMPGWPDRDEMRSSRYAAQRVWVFGVLGVFMIVVGAFTSAGAGAELFGLFCCLGCVIWVWNWRRARRRETKDWLQHNTPPE
jgi:uncharacterized membrane protein YfcA